MMKKYKENKIVKKCLRWINLLVVSRVKCNNGIKRENSTGSLSIIKRAYLIKQGQNEKVCPSVEWQNLNFFKLKKVNLSSSYIQKIKREKDYMTQKHFNSEKNEKEERKRRGKKEKIKRKLIKIAIGTLHISHILNSTICHLCVYIT